MGKIIITIIVTILFSANVAFGQANSGSGGGKGQATQAAGISMVMGAGLIAGGIYMLNQPDITMTTKIIGGIMIAGGVLSLAQGGQQLVTAQGARRSESQSGYSFSGADFAGNDFELSLADGRTLDSKKAQDIMNQGIKKLAEAGVKLKGNGDLTFPNGNTANMNDLTNGNAAGFANAAGLSTKDLIDLKGKIDKANAQAVAAVGKDVNLAPNGASRGIASVEPTNGSNYDVNSIFGKSKAKPNLNRGVAGLSKMVGGQAVGVSQDDIFKMVSRKYEDKKSESFFIEGNWGQ